MTVKERRAEVIKQNIEEDYDNEQVKTIYLYLAS